MGFDKNDNRPVVDPHKRTTKVNIWMVVMIVAFFAIAAGMVFWLRPQP